MILCNPHAATTCSLVHRNSVPSTQMRCMITANRRARARDKISASKRKGLWVGGMAPLGYPPTACWTLYSRSARIECNRRCNVHRILRVLCVEYQAPPDLMQRVSTKWHRHEQRALPPADDGSGLHRELTGARFCRRQSVRRARAADFFLAISVRSERCCGRRHADRRIVGILSERDTLCVQLLNAASMCSANL